MDFNYNPYPNSDELRRQADNYIDLEELRDVISQN